MVNLFLAFQAYDDIVHLDRSILSRWIDKITARVCQKRVHNKSQGVERDLWDIGVMLLCEQVLQNRYMYL